MGGVGFVQLLKSADGLGCVGLPDHVQRPGCGKLYRAHSRLYRNEVLQVNMRLKALAEIYTMHSFAQAALQFQIFKIKFCQNLRNFQKICEIRNFFWRFLTEFF